LREGFALAKSLPDPRPSRQRLVKATAAAAGLDSSTYSGHSLRAGFLTEAAAKRANLFKMKDHSRHKLRDASIFDDHAGEQFL